MNYSQQFIKMKGIISLRAGPKIQTFIQQSLFYISYDELSITHA